MNKLLKLGIVCTSIVSLNAVAFAQIQTDFENTYYLKVKYLSDETIKKATIQVLDDNKPYPIYVGETKNITHSDEDGYTATFEKFKLNDRLLDGTYKIKVGTGGSTEETTFNFENTPAKIRAMQRLKNAATEQAFKDCIDGDYIFLEIDADKYEALGNLQTKFVNALFADLEFDDSAVTAENLAAHKAVLTSCIDKMYELVDLMKTKGNLPDAVDNLQIITLDKTYYDKLTDKTKLIQIYSSYNIENSEHINLSDVQKKFGGACLCAVIATCDYKTAENALKYYANQGIISHPDTSYYDLITSDLYKSEVFDKLKAKNITDYNQVASLFESISQSVYEEYYEDDTPSPEPGGHGGGGGGIIVAKPSDEDTKEEVKEEKKEPDINNNKSTFPDTDSVSWAKEAIEALAKDGCISGDENGNFKPNNKITREEFVKIVVTAFGKYDESATADFKDVNSDAWYYSYIASGVKNGIINGISDGYFGVGENITREDAAVILNRVYNNNSSSGELSFEDNDMIADYAVQAIKNLTSIGVIKGMDDGKFYPKNNLTRAEAVTLIYRLKNLVK